MSEPTTILRVLTKEESHIKKNQYVQHFNSNSIEYIENGKSLNKYQFIQNNIEILKMYYGLK